MITIVDPASKIIYIYLLVTVLQREYFKQGKVDQFRQILEEGSSHGIISLQILVHFCLTFIVLHWLWN